MIKLLLSAAALSSCLCFTSCDPMVQAGSYSPSSSNQPRSGYDLGFRKGQHDGQRGLSRTPSRHSAAYSQADRGAFFRGYEAGYSKGIRPGSGGSNASNPSYGRPLTARNGVGSVTIMEGGRRVAVCRTASPNIERTRFISEQNQIVVKSRGSHGPATVELFDTRTGALRDKVLAFAIRNGQPRWAAGMQD
ncbi:hypothetical protein NT6N_13570 [Oceaniferula spumae]|uniref:Lipoprotein n=1 Tax=Oceaniferula spumae TaxID=2979115 RepID=A0AAT9FK42_9BACT